MTVLAIVLYGGGCFQDGFLYALDATNGTMIWKLNVNTETATPSVTPNGTVIVAFENIVLAVGAEGQVLWNAPLPSEGTPLSPAVAPSGNVIIVTVYGTKPNVFAFSPTGVALWRCVRACAHFSCFSML